MLLWLTPRPAAPDLCLPNPLLPTPREPQKTLGFSPHTHTHLTPERTTLLLCPFCPNASQCPVDKHPLRLHGHVQSKGTPVPPAPGLGNSDSSANPHSVVSCLEGLSFVRPWFPGSVSRDGTGILIMHVLSVCEQMFPRRTVRILRPAVIHRPQTLTENGLKRLSG